jgi:hypothetical protein
MSEVTYAGSLKADPEGALPGPDEHSTAKSNSKPSRSRRHSNEVLVHARSEVFGLKLWAQNVDRDGDLEEICQIPCKAHLARGHYHFALSQSDGKPYAFEEVLQLNGDTTLRAEWKSAQGRRIAGWITFGLGVSAGLGTLSAAIVTSNSDVQGTKDTSAILYGASAIFFALSAGGVVLGLSSDYRKISLEEKSQETLGSRRSKDNLKVWGAVGPYGVQILGQF